MKYIVYLTTNTLNNKIYIGVHKTENPDVFDGYIGCGVNMCYPSSYTDPKTPFQHAVKKYGIKSFKRYVLQIFDSEEEAYNLESILVNKSFIARNDTYNISLGGNKGNYLFPINQFNKDGNFIKSWDNMLVASEALGVSHTSINNAKLFKVSCLGYFWSTDSFINIKEYSYHVGKNVYKYTKNGELIDSYESLTNAAKSNNSLEKTIFRSIQSNIQVQGFYYSFTLVDKFIPKKLPSLKGKIVYIYDLNGNYLTKKESGSELKKYYNVKSYGCLRQALITGKPYKNTQVSLEFKDKLNPVESSTNKAKRIGVYDLNGNLIEEFESIKSASRKYGSCVFRVLNHRQKQSKNLIFKYL